MAPRCRNLAEIDKRNIKKKKHASNDLISISWTEVNVRSNKECIPDKLRWTLHVYKNQSHLLSMHWSRTQWYKSKNWKTATNKEIIITCRYWIKTCTLEWIVYTTTLSSEVPSVARLCVKFLCSCDGEWGLLKMGPVCSEFHFDGMVFVWDQHFQL